MRLHSHWTWFVLLLSRCVASDQTPLLPSSSPSAFLDAGKFSTDELLSLHRNLIEIESITFDEKSVGDWLSDYLEDAGLTVEKQEVAKNRYNIFAYLGKERESQVLVTSHIDTVPPFWPYELKENGTEIWGRGSVDAKACVAAQTIAVLSLLNDKALKLDEDSLSLLFVVGEERSGDGMRFFSDSKPTNYTAVVFGEPTEGKLATGHKGILGWNLDVKGKAAHSGYPWLGLSANILLIEALNELLFLQDYFPSSPKYGNSTLNIGLISGGVAANVVAETASASFALRIANGTVPAIKSMIAKQLAPVKAKAESLGGDFTLTWTSEGYGTVYCDSDIKGFDKITVNYGTDVPNLSGDHKRYLYGPGSIHVAHSDHEHLKVTELEQAVKDYQKIILAVLGK